MKRTILLHATSLLCRAYDTVAPGRVDDDGHPTHALYVCTRAMRTAETFKAPDVAVALLRASPDPAWAEPLRTQHDRLRELCAVRGYAVVEDDNHDDLVAAYTRAALEAGDDVVIVGSDKRMAQLVGPSVWWYDALKDARYTPEMVKKRFLVDPDRVSEWLSLVGDDDTLPGIKGIGAKGATTLLETYGDVATALDHREEPRGRLGNALRAAADEIPAAIARAKLDPGAPLPRALDSLAFEPPDEEAVQAFYGAMGFLDLLEAAAVEEGSIDLLSSPTEIHAFCDRRAGGPLAVHVVTEDPSPARGALVGLGLALADGSAGYVSLTGDSPEARAALDAVAGLLSDAAVPKVGHDAKRVGVAFARRRIDVRGVAGDSEHVSHLLEPSRRAPHDLEIVAKQVLRRPLITEDEVRGTGRGRRAWADLAVEEQARFAAPRALAALESWEALRGDADEAHLAEYRALADVLVGMELRGMPCSAESLQASGAEFERIGERLTEEIYGHAGKRFNLGSTKQLGSVLFEDLGLPIFRRTKTGWSTSTEALERIEHAHPIVPLVIRWRLLRRLTDSWVTALIAAIDDDGRVRSTFDAARSFTGRLVNSAPDLGRVPGRTEEMNRIRMAFAAPPGMTLMSVDYRMLGLYVLAHLSKDPSLVEPLRRGDDVHMQTAAAVLEIDPSDVGPRERQIGKVTNFATFASQGASALRFQLGVSPQEAKDIIRRFHRKYSVVAAFHDEQLRLAKEQGFVVTIAGRRWPIADLDAPDSQIRGYAERLAKRATHEASVSDVARRGLLRAAHALTDAGLRCAPLVQVLDEVIFECPDDEVDEAATVASEAMRSAYDLEVPLRVGVKVGPSWGELQPLARSGS